MKLPVVNLDIVKSLMIDASTQEWVDNMGVRLQKENPVIFGYLTIILERMGEESTLVGLIVYRMLESQLEAMELEELLSE